MCAVTSAPCSPSHPSIVGAPLASLLALRQQQPSNKDGLPPGSAPRHTTTKGTIMRKLILGLAAVAAIATSLGFAGTADAATTGSGTGDMHFVTHYQGVNYVHDAAA